MRATAPRLFATVIAFAVIGYVLAGSAQERSTRRIDLVATKYAFSHAEIRIKKGQSIVLAVSATDFPHGFSVPDFNIRTDLVPGKPVSVAITANRAGKFPYLCDNFCGEGHDRMSGFLIVED